MRSLPGIGVRSELTLVILDSMQMSMVCWSIATAVLMTATENQYENKGKHKRKLQEQEHYCANDEIHAVENF